MARRVLTLLYKYERRGYATRTSHAGNERPTRTGIDELAYPSPTGLHWTGRISPRNPHRVSVEWYAVCYGHGDEFTETAGDGGQLLKLGRSGHAR